MACADPTFGFGTSVPFFELEPIVLQGSGSQKSLFLSHFSSAELTGKGGPESSRGGGNLDFRDGQAD